MVNEPPKGYRGLVHLFEASELMLYSAVAVLLIVIAVISLLDEIWNIGDYLTSATTILGLQELFVTIIILELLMTVIGYMKRRSINLGLLLGAGLTAMIRKIITVGYPSTDNQEFALVLIATAILVAAIIFVGDRSIKA
jgi:uncharacterized membrane protein (DUF373 family)